MYFTLSIVCKGLLVWNDLDKDLQMSPTVYAFKKILEATVVGIYSNMN